MSKIKDNAWKIAQQEVDDQIGSLLEENQDQIIKCNESSSVSKSEVTIKVTYDMRGKAPDIHTVLSVTPVVVKHKDKRDSKCEDPDQEVLPLGDTKSRGQKDKPEEDSPKVVQAKTKSKVKDDPEDEDEDDAFGKPAKASKNK